MYTYICQEQEVLTNILVNRKKIYSQFIRDYTNNTWNIFATGSSYNAAIVVKDFLEKICGIEVVYHNNYNFLYYGEGNVDKGLVIGISQSGSSTSTIRSLEKINTTKIGLTTNTNSKLSTVVDYIQDLHMGVEKVGYVTLGYSAIIVHLLLMGLETAVSLNNITAKEYDSWIEKLTLEISSINSTISYMENKINESYPILDKTNQFVVIGSGQSYFSSKELDTKFIETIRRPVNIRELDEFMHGQYLQLNKNQYVIILETGIESIDQEMRLLKEYIRKHTPNIISIGFDDNEDEDYWRLKTEDLNISMLLRAIPIQLMAYKYAEYVNSDYKSDKFKTFGEFMKSKDKEEV